MSRNHDTAIGSSSSDGAALAVSYLRVSTKEQAEKGGMDVGYSIPAQRDANLRKAGTIGSRVIAEFVDAGESARTADRPDLMRMIQYVQTHKVSYCVVHKVDRLTRNRADDVAIHLALRDAGVMLVSATENFDETPSGMLLHGIMSTIAEFYSRNLATEVLKGMSQKAASGGTIGKAPVGYLNALSRDDLGREVRSVVLTSSAHRTSAGRSRRTPPATGRSANSPTSWSTGASPHRRPRAAGPSHSPSRPFTGCSPTPTTRATSPTRAWVYPGKHEPLVAPEVWYEVHSVLDAHQSAADAHSVHDHYLKGTVYCGSRMMVTHAKNRHGSIYPYFVCAGRHARRTDCTRRAVLIEDVERRIEDNYGQIGLTPTQREALAGMLSREFDRLLAGEADELNALTKQRDKLESEQLKLMQAHYADAIPLPVLKKEQARINGELDHRNVRLERHHGEYADAKAVLTRCLDLLDNFAGLYARCDDLTRRLCNQALFTKVFVEDDLSLRPEPTEPFEPLLDPDVQTSALTWAKTAKGGVRKCSEAQTPADSSSAEGLSLVRMAPSTGVRSDIAELGAGKGDALLIVDAVTSLAGIELRADAWGVDVGYAGTQKCLGVAPGLAPFTINDRAFERRVEKPHSWYLDLGLLGRVRRRGVRVGQSGKPDLPQHRARSDDPVAQCRARPDPGRRTAERVARHTEAGQLLQDGLEEMGLPSSRRRDTGFRS